MSTGTRQRVIRYDLTPFLCKMPWEERSPLIRRTFSCGPLMEQDPTEIHRAWRKLFDREPELMGSILRDILKADQAVPGRPGPRPPLDMAAAEPLVDGWMGQDPIGRPYTALPFPKALRLLAGGRSLRHIASMTGLSRAAIHRLERGEIQPTSEIMMRVAQAFKKQPAFFVEWRIAAVASAIVSNLTNKPERSVKAYEALFWHAEAV